MGHEDRFGRAAPVPSRDHCNFTTVILSCGRPLQGCQTHCAMRERHGNSFREEEGEVQGAVCGMHRSWVEGVYLTGRSRLQKLHLKINTTIPEESWNYQAQTEEGSQGTGRVGGARKFLDLERLEMGKGS